MQHELTHWASEANQASLAAYRGHNTASRLQGSQGSLAVCACKYMRICVPRCVFVGKSCLECEDLGQPTTLEV